MTFDKESEKKKTTTESKTKMKFTCKSVRTLVATLIGIGSLAGVVEVQGAIVTGINFSTERTIFQNTGPISPASSEVAGVVAQQNWNEARTPATSGLTGGTADIFGPNPGIIIDSSGSATGIAIAWDMGFGSQGIQHLSSTASADEKLFANYIEGGPGAGADPMAITLSNLPGSSHDVYVYFIEFGNGSTTSASATVGTTTYHYSMVPGLDVVPSPMFVRAISTDINAPTPNATYALFEGVSGSNFTLDILKTSGNRASIAAIQIVSVPEPSSALLLGFGALSLAAIRRRIK